MQRKKYSSHIIEIQIQQGKNILVQSSSQQDIFCFQLYSKKTKTIQVHILKTLNLNNLKPSTKNFIVIMGWRKLSEIC